MDPNAPATRAGGCLLTLAILAGTVIGTVYHQQSIGFLAGLGVGLVLLVLVWLIDRLRR
jgi:hypothetical protein